MTLDDIPNSLTEAEKVLKEHEELKVCVWSAV